MVVWITVLFSKLSSLFRRERLDSEFDDELQAHVHLLVEDNLKRGMTPDEARRQALLKLGGVTATRELQRETRGLPAWDSLSQDMRYAFRTLGREPGFFAVAVLIIGLGIGATTAMFSVVNPILLQQLPFRDPERLVRISNTGTDGLSGVTSRASNLRDWRKLSESFEDITGYFAFFDYGSYNLIGRGDPERLVGVGVVQNFLELLGVQPELGRNFVDEECIWNGRPAALLTHSLWERRFGSDPAIVGQSITLNDKPTIVVGVLPASFDFASVFSPGSRIDLLTPFPVADQTDRWGNTLAVIGRLKPGVTIGSAQAELDLIDDRLHQQDPARWGLGAAVSGLQEHITGRFRQALIVLTGAVGLVLLIACTNLSNLLLSRAASRRKEVAIRSALGAGRYRLIRQMLTESLVLSGCGALLGIGIAFAVTHAVAATSAISIPLLHSAQVDATALGFTLLVAVSAGLLFGIVPALQISGDEHGALRDSTRGSSEGKGRAWIRGALVVSEIALACMLLVGAGLLLRSFLTLLDVDLGFQPNHAVAWRVDVGDRFRNSGPGERVAFYERLVAAFQAVPGVVSVGLTDTLPLGRNRGWGIRAKGVDYPQGGPDALPRMVDDGYIEAMHIPLIAGRNFNEHDTRESEPVMIINEAAAHRVWPGQDPIGQIALTGGSREWRIIGVVQNVRHSSLEEEAGNEMYMNIRQQGDWGAIDAVVRSKLPVESLAPAIQSALRSLDPTLPTGDFQTLDQIVERAVSPRRFVLLLLGAFTAVALLLASLGIYGVVSYSVNQRTQEIGIRMALGASAYSVRWRVLKKTLTLAAMGIAIGAVGSFALARLIGALLYGVAPTDPLTFAAMMLVLTGIALLAGYLPARRASRIDPMSVLRSS
jgi:putative ABC transport system permease protein